MSAPGIGSSAAYYSLARRIGGPRPIYGLDFEGAFVDIQQLSDQHTDDIQRIVRSGAVHLGGFSFGGHLSVAIAQKLQSVGRDIRCVFLLDSFDPALLQMITPRKLVEDLFTGAGVPQEQLQEALLDPFATFTRYIP